MLSKFSRGILRLKKWVKVRVPASTSNLGPGFDVFGLALALYNEVEVRRNPSVRGISIEIQGEGESSLPRNENNLVWVAMERTLAKAKAPLEGYELKCVNRIPLARGLGSSAAAILSGILAGNALCEDFLTDNGMLEMAVRIEGHPDNVAAQLYGGLQVLAYSGKNYAIIPFDPPKGIHAVVCVPGDLKLSTTEARAALPESVPHKDAVFNASRTALLLGALVQKRYDLLGIAMEDRLHQPYRKKFIPGFDDVLNAAYRGGAYGAALSGSGPSIFALAPPSKAAQVGKEMEKGFAAAGIKAQSMVLKFAKKPEIRIG